MSPSRREFLKGAAFLGAAAALPKGAQAGSVLEPSPDFQAMNREAKSHPIPYADVDPYSEDLSGVTWWKGDVHMHTFLSDGLLFPAEAFGLYKRLGYNFCVQTDHDVTSPTEEFWITDDNRYYEKRMTPQYFERYKKNFPKLFPKIRTGKKGKPEYRVAPFDELSTLVNEKNRFLVVPGNEVTCLTSDGESLHCNFINVSKPCRMGLETRSPKRMVPTVAKFMDLAVEAWDKIVPRDNPELAMLQINHPLWTTFDVAPSVAISHPAARFFEVNNSGSMARNGLPPGDCFTHDKWWDAVNATRATLGQPLIYGTGSSDIHDYEALYEGKTTYPGYVRVASKELTIPALMKAFHKGNFYASTGLELDRVSFDRKTRTLSIAVHPEKGYKYKIIFIGTKKGTEIDVKGRVRWNCKRASQGDIAMGFKLDRQVPYYSPAIGTVLKVSESTTSSYTMEDDDLYVRAKIITDRGVLPETQVQRYPIAWTQPILNRG